MPISGLLATLILELDVGPISVGSLRQEMVTKVWRVHSASKIRPHHHQLYAQIHHALNKTWFRENYDIGLFLTAKEGEYQQRKSCRTFIEQRVQSISYKWLL
jgi:hypothetical protein